MQIIKTSYLFRYFLKKINLTKNKIYEDNIHLNSAISWIVYAKRMGNSGGVSLGYSIKKVWLPLYPETTGYIIPTFLKYAEIFSNNSEFIDYAKKLADWEIDIQSNNGAVRGGVGLINYPIVFNSDQFTVLITKL